MPHRLNCLLIGSLMVAGCTSASDAGGTLPDHFDDNLDVITRSVSHPCGAETDTDGDGAADIRFTYAYDAQGRSRQDLAVDATGALYDQIDYTWDNAGHLTDELDNGVYASFTADYVSTFDTLGRRLEFRSLIGDGGVAQSTDVIAYAQFDELGHSARGDETTQDLTTGSSRTRTRSYAYDALGRRISLEVRSAAGELVQSWQYAYDDPARMVTTTLAQALDGKGFPELHDVYLDTYDADYHLISTHQVSTHPDGSVNFASDTQNQWSGDRQLGTTTTSSSDASLGFTTTTTYKYRCDANATAGLSARTRTSARPHPREMSR